MPAPFSLRHLPSMVCACALVIGCGGDKDRASDEQTAAADRGAEEDTKPTPEPESEPASAAEPVEDDWGDMPALDDAETEGADTVDETDETDETGESEARTEPWPGPCAIRWSSGTQVRFEYAEDRTRGTVRIDLDGDRKSDVCGRFELRDGKATKIEVDEGCNRTFDLEIVPEYDPKTNLANARYTSDGETKPITLVTMPSFGGLDPGYPLHAARKNIDLKVSRGLVRSAHVKQPHQGPPTKVTLTYDASGRLTRLDEDLHDDGTIDRRFNYTYDDLGNVTRITFRFGEGDDAQKGNARLDYRCWSD
jgi:hypothetical protein